MAAVSTMLVYVAAAGALASFIAGAIFSARAGAGWRALIWPFTIGRFRSAGGEAAVLLNKTLVALIACLLVGAAAFSASANLHRFAK